MNNMNENKKISEYYNKDAILTPQKAKLLLEKNDDIIFLDVRIPEEYEIERIDNAINIWRPDYTVTVNEISGLCMNEKELAKKLGDLGISNKNHIIVYDNKGNLDSSRFYWIMKMYGHENISVLDGGLDLWKKMGYVTTNQDKKIKKTEYFFCNSKKMDRYISKEEILKALNNSNYIIVDSRTFSEYSGEALLTGAYRKGKIPSAIWHEWIENLNEDKTFKSVSELNSIYEKKGITKDKSIIVYCQSGVRSSNTTFVLTELLGYQNVKNYDGSWIEWSFYKGLPIN